MGAPYAQKYERLLMAGRRRLARVWPIPGSVVIELSLDDDELSPEQALELAHLIVIAATDAEHLEYIEAEDAMVDDRNTGIESGCCQ